jgi:hypothetical protein
MPFCLIPGALLTGYELPSSLCVLTTRHDGDPRISAYLIPIFLSPFQVGAILRTGNVEAVTVSGSNSLCTS